MGMYAGGPSDDGLDELSGPPRVSRRVVITVVLAAVLAVALLVGLAELGHRAGGRSASRASIERAAAASRVASADRPATGSPATTAAPVSEPTTSDAIAYTGVFAESTSLGSADVTYDFSLVNTTARALGIRYPIRFIWGRRRVLPLEFAGIFDESSAQAHVDGFGLPRHRLSSFPAATAESLLIRIHVDCQNYDETHPTAADPLRIEIGLRGGQGPASFTMPELAGGFAEITAQVCG